MCGPLVFLLLLLLLIGSLLIISSCDDENENKALIKAPCPKPHFVLVHGYGGGAWNWYKLQTLMEASGYNVTSFDLKGAGSDPTQTKTVRTYDVYKQPLFDYMANLSDHHKVILVGHSAGGVSVTAASYEFSKKIEVGVYIAATMLKCGFCTKQDFEDGAPEAILRLKMKQSGGRRGRYEHEKNVTKCPPQPNIAQKQDELLHRMLDRPLPVDAVLSARFKGDEAEKVKRVYIKTSYDQVLVPRQQNAMIRRWPPLQVYEVQSGHDVITFDPFAVFGLLVNVAISIACP